MLQNPLISTRDTMVITWWDYMHMYPHSIVQWHAVGPFTCESVVSCNILCQLIAFLKRKPHETWTRSSAIGYAWMLRTYFTCIVLQNSWFFIMHTFLDTWHFFCTWVESCEQNAKQWWQWTLPLPSLHCWSQTDNFGMYV